METLSVPAKRVSYSGEQSICLGCEGGTWLHCAQARVAEGRTEEYGG